MRSLSWKTKYTFSSDYGPSNYTLADFRHLRELHLKFAQYLDSLAEIEEMSSWLWWWMPWLFQTPLNYMRLAVEYKPLTSR